MNNLIETICRLWWIEVGTELQNPRSRKSILALERVLKREGFEDIVTDYVIETIVRTPQEFKDGEDEDSGTYVDDDETAVSAILNDDEMELEEQLSEFIDEQEEEKEEDEEGEDEEQKPQPKEQPEEEDDKGEAEDDIKIGSLTALEKEKMGKSNSLSEASYLDPKYKPGHKIIFNKKTPPKWAPNLKMGDVITIMTDDPSLNTIGSGEFVKTLELPSGKYVRIASTNRSGGDGGKFIHSKGGTATPSGEDWESLIIVAYNNQFEGYEWERSQKYWDNYGDDAMKIADSFKKVIKSKSLSQLGASTAPLNPEWGGKNKTPKTDILGDSNERISLKKAGGSQLMSGGQDEAIATFNFAMKMVGENKPEVLSSFLNTLEDKMGRMTESGTITALQKLKDSGKKLTPEQEKSIAEMEQLQLNAKEINRDMESVFKDIYFKSCFCFEAATGTNKFADKTAVANQLIEFNPGNGKITAHLPMNKIEDAKPLATSNSFYVSFKSGGSKSKPYLALRTKKLSKKQLLGESIDTFRDIVVEEFSRSDYGISMLNEANQKQLNEFQVFNKLVRGVKGISSKVKSQAKKILDSILKRIKNTFDMIKRLGKNIFNGIMHFLDMEVSTVKISSGGSFPLV